MDIIGGSKPKIVVGPSIIVGLCLRCPLVPNAPTSAPPAMHDYTILHFLMSTVIKKFTWLLVALRNGFGCLGKFWPPLDAADPGNEESPGLPSTKLTPITWTYNHSCRNLHKLSGRPPPNIYPVHSCSQHTKAGAFEHEPYQKCWSQSPQLNAGQAPNINFGV